MKKFMILVCAILSLFSFNACAVKKLKPFQSEICLASPSEVKQISTTAKIVRDFIIQAKDSNTSNIRVGNASVTTSIGLLLKPEGEFVFSALTPGEKTISDMQDWYFTGVTSGDCIHLLTIDLVASP